MTYPQFYRDPVLDQALILAANANTARDGSGSLGTLSTAAAGKPRKIDKVIAIGTGPSALLGTLALVRLFITNTSGTSPQLISETAWPVVTPGTTTPSNRLEIQIGLVMQPGQILKAGWTAATATDILGLTAVGGEY